MSGTNLDPGSNFVAGSLSQYAELVAGKILGGAPKASLDIHITAIVPSSGFGIIQGVAYDLIPAPASP